jgi:pimeloyl-ACP methyl ester carboxylesterase
VSEQSATAIGDPRTIRVEGSTGVGLALDELGPPDGVPVLLIHGGGQTRESWGSVGRSLARSGFRSLSMDLRGHGESDWASDGDYTPAALIGDVEAVQRYAGRPMVLVGASLGGLTSMLYAADHPDKTEALVLVDVVPRNSSVGESRIHRFLSANPDGFGSFDEVVEAVRAYKGGHFREQDQSRLHKNVRRRADGRLVWHWDPAFLLREGRSWTYGKSDALVDAATRLRVSTLLMVGGETDVVDQAALDEFRQLVPEASVVDIPGVSHMVASDDNDAFGQQLLDWLQASEPAR